ncbi:hypothetical protein B0I35DRAFT_483321 [Stachybotrys elegans]|uniref:DUF8035 domain-containing protein n=1 Tax=Stachybotrys elegans TaxID=80388 RepID=A0A8K0SH32_9HYPO|nr:hypothetical protein B0I35DRAFT_483321 [Stachybotrys elegans]
MSGDTTVGQIDAVDAFARSLYLRAKSSPTFTDVAVALRQLHMSLRHLRVEAADPDSLLNNAGNSSSVYARQLQPIVEDCDFALRQLETSIDRYADARPEEPAVADRIAAIRAKLNNERTNVDMFLDTVQLHNPASKPVGVSDASVGLEDIKDKVDTVAQRVFKRPSGGLDAHEGDLWQQFKSELEKEGFSPEVLRKHKDVLRAYIRELESMSTLNGGAPPTVRGLLEYESKKAPSPPKEMMGDVDNEKCLASMKTERPMPDHAPQPHQYQPYRPPPSHEHHSASSEETGSDAGDSLALISTRDLMAMDSLNTGMANMNLHPGYNYGASPGTSQKYLPPHVAGSLTYEPDLSASPNAGLLGTAPRAIPQAGSYTGSAPPPSYGTSPRFNSRLAPDRYGHEIPMDAPWTRIKRTLVSPEVLERAGVRYEARPEYVAILGRLSREEIAEFARQSADCRAARSRRDMRPRSDEKYRHVRGDSKDSKSSRDDDDDEDSVLWDSSDSTDIDDDKTSEKGTKSYPFIVSPPDKKGSPASTVPPKPILKNKNENHVRFDPEPYELESKSPRSVKDRDDRERRHHSRRSRDSRRDSSSRHDRRDRHHKSSDDDYHRREYRDRKSEERHHKKKAWGETLGAVGIGGAAVSLISVLAEAASGI